MDTMISSVEKLQKSMMKLLVSIFLGQLHLPRIAGI